MTKSFKEVLNIMNSALQGSFTKVQYRKENDFNEISEEELISLIEKISTEFVKIDENISVDDKEIIDELTSRENEIGVGYKERLIHLDINRENIGYKIIFTCKAIEGFLDDKYNLKTLNMNKMIKEKFAIPILEYIEKLEFIPKER